MSSGQTQFTSLIERCRASKLPSERLERVDSWGMAQHGICFVYRPSTIDGIKEVYRAAKIANRSIGMRGAGRSYGDSSIASEEISLDLSRMNRILAWDPSTGVIHVEPGVTLQQVWQYCIGDGWWPYVVSGTMYPTIGGMASMNIHGKNNFAVGTIGDHIRSFDLLLPDESLVTCSRSENSDLFHAAIGGFGMLGCFTRIELELKKIHSGLISVLPISVPDLSTMLREIEERQGESDYLVGWLDCFARGKSLGRGLIHQANYLKEGEDPRPAQTLQVSYQDLPDTFLGGAPKSIMWRLMKPWINDFGMCFINSMKYHSGRLLGDRHHHHLTHAGFNFLLDYVPNWKWSYRPGGLIQYQCFVPAEKSAGVFQQLIELQHQRGITAYLGVVKKHRPDPFLMTHGLNGYSLAMDFKVTSWNRSKLWSLAAEMDKIVIEAEGRFYFAKDSTLNHERAKKLLDEPRVKQFLAIKRRVDPSNLFQTDLYRRVFGKPE